MLTVDLVITRAHVHRFVRFFAFAAHQDIVELIELRLANLLLHLTIRDVDFREMTGLAELALDLVAVVSRGFRDRHNHDLFWRQPIRPLTRKVLGQNREHTLDRTEDSSVNDDRPHRRVVFVDVRQVKSSRKLKVELDRRTLEATLERIEDSDVNLRTVEGAVTFVQLPLSAASVQRRLERRLRLVPHLQLTQVSLWTRR